MHQRRARPESGGAEDEWQALVKEIERLMPMLSDLMNS
jgi:hypothetical protein